MSENIYIVHTREFIALEEDVYKIGRTKRDIINRLAGYPKGSVLKFCRTVTNCAKVEKEIKNVLKKKHKQREDLGQEWFEGNYDSIEEIVDEIIVRHKKSEKNVNIDERSVNKVVKTEDTVVIKVAEVKKEIIQPKNVAEEDNLSIKEIRKKYESLSDIMKFRMRDLRGQYIIIILDNIKKRYPEYFNDDKKFYIRMKKLTVLVALYLGKNEKFKERYMTWLKLSKIDNHLDYKMIYDMRHKKERFKALKELYLLAGL